MTSRHWPAALAVGTALALGPALFSTAAASAQPLRFSSASTTPTPTPASDPYAEHVHTPGDSDSDPTWVWVAGGGFAILVGGGLVAHLVTFRRPSTNRSG